MIGCAEAVRQLWEYLDGTVTAPERDRVEEHLDLCRRCCGELEFAQELRGMLRRTAQEPPPTDVLRRLTRRLEELA